MCNANVENFDNLSANTVTPPHVLRIQKENINNFYWRRLNTYQNPGIPNTKSGLK